MGLFNFFKNKKEDDLEPEAMPAPQMEPNAAPQPHAEQKQGQQPQQDVIRFFDRFGRPVAVPKEQWRTTVLPKTLEAHYEDASKLYVDILNAVQQGMHSDVLQAAQHLLSIDENAERSHIMLSIVYQRMGQLDYAQKVLEDYITAHGKTGIVLTNLAKVFYQKGEKQQAEDTLWEGLQLDPNQSNGLPWYATIQLQKSGRDAYLDALHRASQVEGAWLPQLYLAREDLRDKHLEQAMERYHAVLKQHTSEAALLMATGDLGRAGCFSQIVELAAPIYQIQTHGPRVGMNLLHAYISLKDYEHGEPLLSSLLMLERPELKDVLMRASQALEQMRPANIEQPVNGNLQIQMLAFDKPIWYYSLGEPAWMLPKAERPVQVVVMPYADVSHTDATENHAAKEDDSGRLTRSIPLYLLEQLLYHTSYAPRVVMPYAKDIGPILSKAEPTEPYIRQACEQFDSDYLITGSILASPMGYGVNTIIYDRKQDRFQRLMKIVGQDAFGASLQSMTEDILQALPETAQPALSMDFSPTPSEALLKQYLIALGQSLTQTFVVNGQMKRDALWGERNMLNWYLNLSLSDPANAAARILLLSGLSKSRLYRSHISLEFEKQALQLFTSSKQRMDQLMLPFLLRIYHLQEPLDKLKAAIPEERTDAYAQWVRKL